MQTRSVETAGRDCFILDWDFKNAMVEVTIRKAIAETTPAITSVELDEEPKPDPLNSGDCDLFGDAVCVLVHQGDIDVSEGVCV